VRAPTRQRVHRFGCVGWPAPHKSGLLRAERLAPGADSCPRLPNPRAGCRGRRYTVCLCRQSESAHAAHREIVQGPAIRNRERCRRRSGGGRSATNRESVDASGPRPSSRRSAHATREPAVTPVAWPLWNSTHACMGEVRPDLPGVLATARFAQVPSRTAWRCDLKRARSTHGTAR
jgi:hypothetical protein